MCHPFYTGKHKFLDTAGRIEKFTRKYDWGEGKARKKLETAKEKKQKIPSEKKIKAEG
jgi:large subunit ribosomal protein L31